MTSTDIAESETGDAVVSQRLTTLKQVVANGADYACLTCGATVYERDLFMPLLEGHERVSRYTVRDFTVRCESCVDGREIPPEFKITPPPEDPEVYLSTGSIAEATRISPEIVGDIRDNIVLPFEDAFASEGDEWYGDESQPTLITHDPDADADVPAPVPIDAPGEDRFAGAKGDDWEPPQPPAGLLTTLGKTIERGGTILSKLNSLEPATIAVLALLGIAVVSASLTWGMLAGVALASLSIAGIALYSGDEAPA